MFPSPGEPGYHVIPGSVEEAGWREEAGKAVLKDDPSVHKDLFLPAHFDQLANVRAFSQCLCTGDIKGDGDYRLLVADEDKKLKVFQGTGLASEHSLLDMPSAVCCFYSDEKVPRLPAIAVAAGTHVFIYRNLRPYFKFTLPNVVLDDEEERIWNAVAKGEAELDPMAARDMLAQLRESGVVLSSRSMDLLRADHPQQIYDYCDQVRHIPLLQQTVVTCMCVIRKSSAEAHAVGCLIVGTEGKEVMVLDPSGTTVDFSVALPSVPVFLCAVGQLDLEHRVLVVCRDCKVYAIKNKQLATTVIILDAQVVGIVPLGEAAFVVGTILKRISGFSMRGRRAVTHTVPSEVLAMEGMTVHGEVGYVVGLRNGELRVYNRTVLVRITKFQSDSPVCGIHFARYGREAGAMISTHKNGALSIKLLPRQASLSAKVKRSGPPPEQDMPLDIPRKTRLYVENTQREHDQAAQMHRIFQRDLMKLKLRAAKAYHKVLTDGNSAISDVKDSKIRLNASVQGLGPVFRINFTIQNTGDNLVTEVYVLARYDHDVYRLKRGMVRVSALVPHLEYPYWIDLECVDPNGAADDIRLLVFRADSQVPILTALVRMPMSDIVVD